MKRIIILGIALFCVQWMNAQTECENMFSKAKTYYARKDYAKAKDQFQKVVKLCPSNADIAQEYIRLCDGYLNLAEQRQNQNRADKSTIDSLNRKISRLDDKIRYLEKDSIPFYTNLLIKAKAENDSLKKVTNEQQQIEDSCEREKSALFESLRALGIELNGYLEDKLSKDKDNKQRIRTYEGISNDSLMGVFRENVKLVNDIKTPVFF